MKIVHILFEPPSQMPTGARLRNGAIDAALKQFHDTFTLSIQEFLGLGSRFLPRGAANISVMFTNSQLGKIVNEIQAQSPELVIIDGVYLIRIAEALRSAGLRVIVVSHNVESTLLRRVDEAETPTLLLPLVRLLNRRRWQRAEVEESKLGLVAEAIWVCSEPDARDLAALAGPDVAIKVVPNPVPQWCEALRPNPARLFPEGRVHGVFVGHLNYKPNVLAAQELARSIVPAIRKSLPAFSLTVAGYAPRKPLRRKLQSVDAIDVIASPEQIHPIYAAADLAIMPLTVGGGTRIKALEAMACGVPLVASSKAIEGLGLSDQKEFLLANSPQDYARAVTRLAENAELRQQIVENASRFVESRHSQAALYALVGKLLPN